MRKINLIMKEYKISLKYLVLFTLFATNLVDQPAPEVVIEQGTLSGITNGDGSIFEYVGIPYGVANSSNRFQAPFPPPSWKGVFKATDGTVSCPQKTAFGVSGVEDCLKINIYVPATAKKPIPVMFYIHGGAFVLGSGGKLLLGPEFLVKHNVILVTFNYRLGALGFLCLGIKEAPGNAGLKDQLAALRWVKKNIAAFGGDPDNITIFGESAGGTSVSLFIASEATEGLFNKAIVQSGSSIASWSINSKPILAATLFTKALGHKTEDPKEIYEILSKTSVSKLVNTKVKKKNTLFFDTELIHLPCIEEPLTDVEPFLTDLPYNIIDKKRKNLTLMYGTMSREGLFLISGETDESLEQRNNLYVFASDLQFETKTKADSIARKVKQFYYGDEIINRNKLMEVEDQYTHLYFEMPSQLEAEHFVAKKNLTVYNYYFDYSGNRNFLKFLSGYYNEKGACHADELLYLFKGTSWPFWINEADRQMIDWMTRMWTNFAKYGDPTPDEDENIPIKWKPSDRNGLRFIYIDSELKMGPIPNPEAYELWKDIYTKHRRRDLKTPPLLKES